LQDIFKLQLDTILIQMMAPVLANTKTKIMNIFIQMKDTGLFFSTSPLDTIPILRR